MSNSNPPHLTNHGKATQAEPQLQTSGKATRPLLRIAICGTPASGKSALTKRLLHALGASAPIAPEKATTQWETLAYYAVSSRHHRFIVMDIPSHSAQARLVAEACSEADVAILLVDGQVGIEHNACLHARLAAEFRVPHLVLAINQNETQGNLRSPLFETLTKFVAPLDFKSVTIIPLSTATGANIDTRSTATAWYTGPTLTAYLESLQVGQTPSARLAFPVQTTLSCDDAQHHLAGTVLQGLATPGDMLRVSRTGATGRLERIFSAAGDLPQAEAGQAVTLLTSPPLNAQHGDILCLADGPLETSDQFEATLVWMSEDHGLAGRNYELCLANQRTKTSITSIKSRINVINHAHEAARRLALNEIGIARIATETPIAFDQYRNSKALGCFTLSDMRDGLTVAAGLIHHSLRRAQNVHRQALSITRQDREQLNGHKGKVVWFTGLSGSGKSTLANALEVALHADGRRTYVLDGDNVRQGLNKDLGFTDADRVENIRRIAEVAKLMMDAGLIVLTAFISPFRQEREMARDLIGADNFIEVFVSTPLETCEERDPKGLYKKARNGQLPNMTGIGSPYEAPENPSISIDASKVDIATAVNGLQKEITALEIDQQ